MTRVYLSIYPLLLDSNYSLDLDRIMHFISRPDLYSKSESVKYNLKLKSKYELS